MDVDKKSRTLDTLYRSYAVSVQRMLSRRVGPDEAQDLVQDCYLRILERANIDEILHPQAFVFTVAANLAVNHIEKASVRARHVVSPLEIPDVASEEPSPDVSTIAARTLAVVTCALGTLPANCRTAFILNRVEGMSYVAVSKQLNISEKSVERYISKALTVCQAALGEPVLSRSRQNLSVSASNAPPNHPDVKRAD